MWSKEAFAACVYLRTVSADNNVHSKLLTAKSKIAPLKIDSIPWLELIPCVLSTIKIKTRPISLQRLGIKVKDRIGPSMDRVELESPSTK